MLEGELIADEEGGVEPEVEESVAQSIVTVPRLCCFMFLALTTAAVPPLLLRESGKMTIKCQCYFSVVHICKL